MSTSCEVKMRTLAMADPSLQAIFGAGPFRWFDRQLEQGYIQKGACVRVRRISTESTYSQEAPLALEKIRFQFDVLDFSPQVARAGAAAIAAWFTTVDFMHAGQFQSPPTGAIQTANYQINQRSSIEFQLERECYVETQDFRIMNNPSI